MPVVKVDIVSIPKFIMSLYRNFSDCTKTMSVNKAPFPMPISQNLKSGTSKHIPNVCVPTFVKVFKYTNCMYAMHGFILRVLKINLWFEPLCSYLAEVCVLLNTCATY